MFMYSFVGLLNMLAGALATSQHAYQSRRIAQAATVVWSTSTRFTGMGFPAGEISNSQTDAAHQLVQGVAQQMCKLFR